jgi:predicted transcriptional regulator
MVTSTTSLKLPEDLKDRIASLAHGVAQTPHAYMVEAIAEKVGRDEKRQEFIASARESVAQFKRTGIAYALEDVEPYILKRAAGKKSARPKPIKIPRSRR